MFRKQRNDDYVYVYYKTLCYVTFRGFWIYVTIQKK